MKDIAALTVVARINELLEKREWTRAELAKRLGVKPPSVTRMLSGRTICTDSLVKLSKVFGVKIGELFEGEPAKILSNGRKKK